MTSSLSDYETRKVRLQEQMRRLGSVRLDKKTSNLFREREAIEHNDLSVRDFNHVLSVDIKKGWAEVEGMTTYEDFVAETLQHGFMPAIVPQLKTITVGGAVAGIGIESSSFRYGLVHETMLEIEVLLASGETIVCTAKENADLFYSFPNSYGTFGYALRLKMKVVPVKPFVKIEHTRYNDTEKYFAALKKVCDGSEDDFVDGAVFDPAEMYIITGKFVDEAPFTSDYTYMDIYYKSIRTRKEDYLSVRDYIWRWDTDWFWCSAAFGAENPLIRRIFGKKRLNSAVYWKIKNFAQRHPFIMKASAGFSRREYIIQDVDIPIANATKVRPAHVPAKACPALDAGWPPVRRQEHAPINESRAHPDSIGTRCALALRPAKLAWRDTQPLTEMTRQVALVGKACGAGYFRQRESRLSEHFLRSFDAPLRQILMRGEASGSLEFAGKMMQRKSGDR